MNTKMAASLSLDFTTSARADSPATGEEAREMIGTIFQEELTAQRPLLLPSLEEALQSTLGVVEALIYHPLLRS